MLVNQLRDDEWALAIIKELADNTNDLWTRACLEYCANSISKWNELYDKIKGLDTVSKYISSDFSEYSTVSRAGILDAILDIRKV